MRYWLPVLLWMAAITVATSVPLPPVLEIEGGDRIAHAVSYAVLGALLMRAMGGAAGLGPGPAAMVTVMWGGLYGAFDELHQAFLATRTCSLVDWIADLVGVMGAVVICLVVAGRRRERRSAGEGITTQHMGDDAHV